MTVARSQHTPLPQAPSALQALLRQARLQGASDLHLRSNAPPWWRVHGHMHPMMDEAAPQAVIPHDHLQAWLETLLPAQDMAALRQGHSLDTAWHWPELGRYRVNAFLCDAGLGLVLRCISNNAPTLASLSVPAAVTGLLAGAGLVLVTGPTGSGKSTTLAAMVAHLNAHTSSHIITLEDPIEFLHTSAQSLITQREMGRDTPDFAQALRAALREDPDVLLIGEMRDLDTIRLALTAAETGHLVLASLHSRHATSAVERILDVFDGSEKALVRTQLADVLSGVLSQRLVPCAEGSQRCALYELLIATPAIRHLIREGKTPQIASAMQTGAAQGMVTFGQAQAEAERAGRIARGQAQASAG